MRVTGDYLWLFFRVFVEREEGEETMGRPDPRYRKGDGNQKPSFD